MKWIGIVIIICSAIMYGFFKASELRKSLDELKMMQNLIKIIERETRLYRKSLSEILKNKTVLNEFEGFSFIKDFSDCNANLSQTENLRACFKNNILKNKEADMITKSFLLSMGNGDITAELLKVSDYREQLDDIVLRANTEYQKKGKLYKKLSLLFGTAIAILLI